MTFDFTKFIKQRFSNVTAVKIIKYVSLEEMYNKCKTRLNQTPLKEDFCGMTQAIPRKSEKTLICVL